MYIIPLIHNEVILYVNYFKEHHIPHVNVYHYYRNFFNKGGEVEDRLNEENEHRRCE